MARLARMIFRRRKTDTSSPAGSEQPAPATSERDEFSDMIESVQGAISIGQARLLRKFARQVSEGVIIEVGSFRGRSTVALSVGSREGANAAVFAIDPHEEFDGVFGGKFGPPDRRAFFESMLSTGCWQNVRLVNLSSEVVSAAWQRPVELLWIDGDHSYEGVRRDFDCWVPHLLPGGTIALDDTEAGGGPAQLVEELLAEGWTVTKHIGKLKAVARLAEQR